MKKSNKGFTLIEVLIVVVIIAILAALVMPRLLSQPERANIAEAQQMMGAMRRALVAYADQVGSATSVALATNNAANWPQVGLVQPTAAGFDKWIITCNAGNLTAAGTLCNATRQNVPNGTRYNGGAITIPVAATNSFTCGPANIYALVEAADATKGCTVAV